MLPIFITTLFFHLMVIGESTASPKEEPIVHTPLGKVRGHTMTSREGRRFFAFSGLPYAKPPVGKLRFQPPEPPVPWTGVRDAKEDGPFCLQYNHFDTVREPIGVEDCLYLSLYTHNVSGSAPVLVHFHGGGFSSGNGARNTGPQYLMDEDVVIVDVNYRLSMFGFLSFGDLEMPGNQGMKDQVQSLRWVQQNIARFGGNPKSVTIFGESAGAGSVYHHTVSLLSRGLFHKAIAESGSSYNAWAVRHSRDARKSSFFLLSLLGCNHTSSSEAVACLLSKDANEIVLQSQYMLGWQIDKKYDFVPVLEPPSPGAFLVGPVSKWKHEPVPFMMGTTSGEGLLRTLYFPYYNMSYEWFTDNFEELAPLSLMISNTSTTPLEVVRALRQYYLPNKEITENDWYNLTMLYGDSWFAIGILDGANKHPGGVYFYYFDYLGENSVGGKDRNTTIIFGAFHTEEINFLWYRKEIGELKGQDLEVSKKVVKMWTDFAKYGTPAPKGSGLQWKKWTPKEHNYLEISKKGYKPKVGFAEEKYRFWKTLNYYDLFDNNMYST